MDPNNKVVSLLLIAVCLIAKEGSSLPMDKMEDIIKSNVTITTTMIPPQSTPAVLVNSSLSTPETISLNSSQSTSNLLLNASQSTPVMMVNSSTSTLSLSSSQSTPKPSPESSSIKPITVVLESSETSTVSDEALLQSIFSVLQDEIKTTDAYIWKYYGPGQNYDPFSRFDSAPQYDDPIYNYYNKWSY